jgi:putative PIN family toxin of toxin-antitoxin system
VRVVLDTNVLVSGLLTPFGTSGEIVRMLTSNEITLCMDARILLEYENVLRRPRFNIDESQIDVVIEFIQHHAQFHSTVPLNKPLPDADDNSFLEVAISSDAECLVTGNRKHFPARCRAGVQVLSPGEFLDFYRIRKSRIDKDHS